MGNVRKTLRKVLTGTSDCDIRFPELCGLLEAFGFALRIRGSHHIFWKEGVEEILNLQPRNKNQAKPYQVKQVRELILHNRLELK
jgi:predicted RNA binding protein YcfA (HicA-like mRNA interferase family)